MPIVHEFGGANVQLFSGADCTAETRETEPSVGAEKADERFDQKD